MILKTLSIYYRVEGRYKRTDESTLGWCVHDESPIPDLEAARKELSRLRKQWPQLEFRAVRIHESIVNNA